MGRLLLDVAANYSEYVDTRLDAASDVFDFVLKSLFERLGLRPPGALLAGPCGSRSRCVYAQVLWRHAPDLKPIWDAAL